jgi:ABC-type lipoprotein release transport system permease subunit
MADGIQSSLFGVTGHDPITFLLVGVVVAGVSLVAVVVPARRAMQVAPIVALRAD